MKHFILPSKWKTKGDIVLEKNAEEAVRIERSMLIVAGPGAGKTELLAQKTGYLFQTNLCPFPQKILAISFKKDAAENLKDRIKSRYGHEYAARFTSLTYDAFAKKTLDQFRNTLPSELRPNKDYQIGDNSIIEAAFYKCGYKNLEQLSGNRLYSYFDQELLNTTLPLRDNSLSSEVWRLLLKGFDAYTSCLTFKMISKLSNFIYTTNPYVLNSLRLTYSHVFLDEFQDTTSLQYSLVKNCFKNTSTLMTAVGDNKQRIMTWAGARKTVFSDFQNDFNAEKISLIMNHRSAPRLIELQKLMYESLQETDLELYHSPKWKDEDGRIQLFISSNETTEASYLVEDILERIRNGTEPNDICILVKQMPQNYTEQIISKLFECNIKARIETEYQDLLKERIVMLILDILLLGMHRRAPDEWEFVNKAWIEINGLEGLFETDEYYQKHKQLIKLLDETKSQLLGITNEDQLKNLIFEILDKMGSEKINSIYPSYAQGVFKDTLLSKVSTLLWKEYAETREWRQTIENFKGNNSIPIMTIHKSKGLEYSAVYFVGLEDGAFWNFRNQPGEDRCAFFVALSRAKQYLSFSFCSYREQLLYKQQNRNQINEFFELLKKPGIASIIECD